MYWGKSDAISKSGSSAVFSSSNNFTGVGIYPKRVQARGAAVPAYIRRKPETIMEMIRIFKLFSGRNNR